MPITFYDKTEALDYKRDKEHEGYSAILTKTNNEYKVSLTGKGQPTKTKEVFQETTIKNKLKKEISRESLEGMREPILRTGPVPSKKEVDKAISNSIKKAMSNDKGKVGMFLSGGVDSVMLLEFVTRRGKVVPVFTIVSDSDHPDLIAAKKIAKEYGLEHHILIPKKEDLLRAKKAINKRGKLYKGDIAVYLALELAKDKKIDTILAGDGIDEMTGGYWWHANTSDKFSSKKEAFEHYWNRLKSDHIEPMLDSANRVGIKVEYPFLDKELVSVLNRIPLEERTNKGITKKWWKEFARSYVPEYIVSRPKAGFVDALDESIIEEKD